MSESAHYLEYLRLMQRLDGLIAAGLGDGDEADALREEMVEPWRALSAEERKRADDFVMNRNEL